MKTPDMAKENNFVLREAAKAACDGYFTHLAAGGKGDPAEERWIEALTAGADAITQVVVLESRLAQVEMERDAAVHDINFYQSAVCFTCSNHIPPEERDDWRTYCKRYGRLPEAMSDKRPTFCGGYNWRGVCKENAKEE